MKVLRLTPHFYHDRPSRGWPAKFDPVGGMQVQIRRLSEGLAAEGVEQVVLTTGMPGVPRYELYAERVHVYSVRCLTIPVRSKYTGTFAISASWALGVVRWLLVNKPVRGIDVIHCHANGLVWPLLAGLFAARYLGVPLALTLHCSRNTTYHPVAPIDRLLHKAVQWIERVAVARASSVIALTERTREALCTVLPACVSKSRCVPDGLCLATFDQQAVKAEPLVRAKLSRLPPHHSVIGYVGRIDEEKGWPSLVLLACAMRDEPVHFLVCGDGAQANNLRAALERENLTGRFTFMGFVARGEVPAILKRMSVLVLPSGHEELGGVLLEAMAAATPIVAFAVGGVPEVLAGGKFGKLVEPRNDVMLAHSVREVLAAREPLGHLDGSATRTWLEERFSLSAVVADTKQIYAGLARVS